MQSHKKCICITVLIPEFVPMCHDAHKTLRARFVCLLGISHKWLTTSLKIIPPLLRRTHHWSQCLKITELISVLQLDNSYFSPCKNSNNTSDPWCFKSNCVIQSFEVFVFKSSHHCFKLQINILRTFEGNIQLFCPCWIIGRYLYNIWIREVVFNEKKIDMHPKLKIKI